jgi:hypothetical protein
VREQVEVLKTHANFRADLIDIFHIGRQLDAISDDLAL